MCELVEILRLEPPPLKSFEVTSLAKEVGADNIFEVSFQAPVAIGTYAAGARIWVEFPTQDEQGLAFPMDLGYGDQKEVACWHSSTSVDTC